MKIRKILLIAAASILLTALLAGGVYAAATFLHGKSNTVTNNFEAEVDNTPSIEENFDGVEKTEVKVAIPETGYSVYVRAAIIVNWQKTEENETFVYPVTPVEGQDGDYALTIGSDKWFKQGDFYYYEEAVPGTGEGLTDAVIGSCTQLKDPPEGYTLHVEVLTQTIQAAGTTDVGEIPAVTNAWGVTVNNGKLVEG